MFKRIMGVIANEKFGYSVWVFFFCLVVVTECHPATVILYGYFLARRAYEVGMAKERKHSIETYEPILLKAKNEIDKRGKEIAEANRQLGLLKEQVQKYENLS